MLDKNGNRQLAYVVAIDEIRPIPNYDRVEHARVGGWWVIVKKDQFKVGDLAIYIEVDSKVPEKEPFMFLEPKHFKVKTLKMCKVISQGLLMHPNDFGWTLAEDADGNKIINWGDKATNAMPYLSEGDFLTQELSITYADAEDNKRKAPSEDKYKKMAQRHGKLFAKQPFRWLMKRTWGKKLLFLFFGKKRDNAKTWPVGKFPGVSKTDQERAENMTWVLNDKTPFIVTQKCDGSSGTYILEKKGRNKFEFYVCSRNVRMASKDQECFYGSHNYYWEVAEKYNIEEKMKEYLNSSEELKWVCWQGEICAPNIQKNPHKLSETHFYCFHWTDNLNGRMNIVDAADAWSHFGMEVVPIVDVNYIMPDNFEEFKLSADGFYDATVCEGAKDCPREGYVYYKVTDPTFSFKNVSREYLINH